MEVKERDPIEICLQKVRQQAIGRGRSPKNTLRQYKGVTKLYLEFVNSKEGLEGEITHRVPRIRIIYGVLVAIVLGAWAWAQRESSPQKTWERRHDGVV
jgi:hypothetical protein